MSYFILSEPGYETSCWHQAILNGLIAEKQQKRFSLIFLQHISDLIRFPPEEKEAIFLLGNDSLWIADTTAACEAVFGNRVIVLGNHVATLNSHRYSVVSSDIYSQIAALCHYLQYYGKHRIALYGIHPDSASDSYKKEAFLSCGGSADYLFENIGNLAECFDRFLPHIADYDGVICVNDYAAVSLCRHLRDLPASAAKIPPSQKLYITSCGGHLLSGFVTPGITHTRSDYAAFGRAGIDLCRLLIKNSNITAVNLRLAGTFYAGETTDCLPLPEAPVTASVPPFQVPEHRSSNFYTDSETREILKIEALLNSCSASDFEILEHLLCGETYSAIADHFYLSTNGLQYKLKNWFRLCNVASRQEFLNLLRRYRMN